MASSAQHRAARRGWNPFPLLVLAAVAVILVATSCAPPSGGMASPPSPTSRSTPTIGSPQPSMPGQVPRELEFTAPRLGGGTIRGATFAGQDLVVWFWAPW